MHIDVDPHPSPATLAALCTRDWPVWEAGISTFDWYYDETETCHVLAGEVVVTPKGGAPVRFGSGALVIFPRGLSCTWEIIQPVRKHYRFG